jgi:hypothetical protein
MLRSPAWRALSLSARRVLDRLEIEMADHGGTDNGKLPATYDDFVRYGVHRHAIAPALREAVALGFLEVTEKGRAGNAEWRKPNLFRLTYRNTDYDAPTNEWEKIETDEQAGTLARAARKASPGKTKSQWRKTPSFSVGNRHRKRKIHGAETITTAHSAETATTLDISGHGERSAPEGGAVASSPCRVGAIDLLMRTHGCSHAKAVEIWESIPDASPRSSESGGDCMSFPQAADALVARTTVLRRT